MYVRELEVGKKYQKDDGHTTITILFKDKESMLIEWDEGSVRSRHIWDANSKTGYNWKEVKPEKWALVWRQHGNIVVSPLTYPSKEECERVHKPVCMRGAYAIRVDGIK